MATSSVSQTTTPHRRADDVPRPVVVRTDRYPDGNRMGAHEHRKAQLVYSPDGVLRVATDVGTFVVPPEWAVWVPSWMRHDVQSSTPLTLRSVYVEPESATNLPDRCCVVSVPPLLRELILESAALPDLYEVGGPDGRLMAVIIDRITALDHRPVVVPQVRDELLLPIADALTSDPADARGLDDWGRRLGASSRTLSRRFVADVGMPYATWRRQVRLLAALELLAAGESVAAVAFAVGYESASAFIAAFTRSLGVTPGRWFRSDAAASS
ncbi:MAG TPA: helix-turn-helix transcriptional regulator [Acidimicrobiia bacterium]|nr:helix-turn-helix transcriptional regulator [Acidimicrobiia bacterium]